MGKLKLLPPNRGIRLKPYMRFMKEIVMSYLFLILLFPVAFYAYYFRDNIQTLEMTFLVVVGVMTLLAGLLAYYLAGRLFEETIFFAKWDRLARLSRFLYENGYVYEKKAPGNGQKKVKFPRIYLKQKRFDLEVYFELAGSKFQEKFKKIGGDLETTFAMDFMETEDDNRFKMYRLAYSALLARIKVTDIRYVADKGVELMKGFYWDFVSDPHMLIVGGTGGGKTVLLRILILCLSKIGVVDICDPKRADFATMVDLPAFKERVFYDIDSIVKRFEDSLAIMEERYNFMRAEQQRLGHTDMKTFWEYGLEPYFLVCDEYNAFKMMLDWKQAERVDNAIGQFLLLGRQAGCYAIIAMQKPSREDLGSKLQANINFRVAVGRLDEMGYDLAFEEVNRNKEFKFMKFVGGMRVFGRGYAAVKGQVAREFYSPVLVKDFSFYDEFSKIIRREHKHSVYEESPETVNFSLADMMQDLDGNVDDFEGLEEPMFSIGDVTGDLGKSFNQIKSVIDLCQSGNYHFFDVKDGKVVLTSDDCMLLKELFTLKEAGSLSWKEFLKDYFSSR